MNYQRALGVSIEVGSKRAYKVRLAELAALSDLEVQTDLKDPRTQRGSSWRVPLLSVRRRRLGVPHLYRGRVAPDLR